jgi:hypothetical protein
MPNNGLFMPSDFSFLYSNIPDRKLKNMKEHFRDVLKKMKEWEYANAPKQGLLPTFTDDVLTQQLKILEQVKDCYELEAMKKAIIDENLLPDSYDEVKKGGDYLRIRRDETN